MSHVQTGSAGVGEHVQHVELLLSVVFHHPIGAVLHPSFLPFPFNFSKIVFHISALFFVYFLIVCFNTTCKDTLFWRDCKEKSKKNEKQEQERPFTSFACSFRALRSSKKLTSYLVAIGKGWSMLANFPSTVSCYLSANAILDVLKEALFSRASK